MRIVFSGFVVFAFSLFLVWFCFFFIFPLFFQSILLLLFFKIIFSMRTSIIRLFSTFPSTRFWKQFQSFFFFFNTKIKEKTNIIFPQVLKKNIYIKLDFFFFFFFFKERFTFKINIWKIFLCNIFSSKENSDFFFKTF